MSRSGASKRPTTSTRSSSTLQTTSTTSHDFHSSPLDAILAEQGLQRYRLEPPSWRAPWTGSEGGDVEEDQGKRGLSWPVFYPTKDGMDEDQLTESAVKQGYAAKLPIQADTFSAHGHILDNLKAKGMLENLSRIVTAVQQKREANLPSYGPSTFRLPSRITLTDSKREAWFSDLANPSVPLSKLSRSVPHGYKGEKGLDMLAMRKVEIGRAVWFVRAFGGVEIQSLAKSRPLPTAIFQYTTEFSTVVCEFIRKQLLDLALPDSDTPTPSISNHSRTRTTSAGLMSSVAGTRLPSDFKEPQARTAWKEKFDYTLSLVASLLSASLLSTPQFTRFMVSLVDPANTTLAQLSVALLLIEEYWNEVLEDESSTARLARSCLIRLEEIENIKDAPSSSLYTSLAVTLTSLVRSAFLALPDAFVSISPTPIFPSTTLATSPVPLLPAQISEKLENVLLEPVSNLVTADDIDQDPSVLAIIRSDLADLAQRRRLENLEGTAATNSNLPRNSSENASSSESRERAQLDLISHLDNFAFPQVVSSLHSQLFVSSALQTPTLSASSSSPNPSVVSPALKPSLGSPSDPPRPRARSRSSILPLEDALPTLFTWSTTPCRSSSQHRRYTVANLVSLELERQKQMAEKERSRQGARTRSKMSTAEINGRNIGNQGIGEIFVKWIDERYGDEGEQSPETFKTNKQIGSREDVRALAEELMRVGAIRYGGYMQRMIARGETERKTESGMEGSMHLWILKTAAIDDGNEAGSARGDFTGSIEVSDKLVSVQAELAKMIPGWKEEEVQEDLVGNNDHDARTLLEAISRLTDVGHRLTVTRKIVPDRLSNVLSSGKEFKITDETFALMVDIFTRAYDFAGLSNLVVILLQSSPSPSLLVAIADLINGRLDLWTAIGELSQMAAGLYSNLAESGGSTRRRLLACLKPLALAGYLKGQATETVLTASQSLLALSLQTSNIPTSLPSPLVDLQTLTIDSTPIAVSQLVTTLFGRYGHSSSDSWITLVIDGGIQLLPQLPTIDPIVSLLKELDERVPEGLEAILIRWMRGKNPQHLVSILGGAQGSQLVGLLSELVVEGVLSLPLLVSEGFLPIWRSILVLVLPELAKADSEPLSLDASLSQALSVLTEALARAVNISPVVPPAMSSAGYPFPTAITLSVLLRQQRKSLRLGGLFSTSAVPAVSSLLSLLVLQQEVFHAAGSTEEAQNASSLFLQIVNLEQFQSVVIKVPQSIRMGMLESEFVKSLPSFEFFKPKLLAGLLVALKDGGEATPANLVSTEDWDIFLSGLTMWRLAVSKVEVEACLERLELDSSLTTEDKDGALHILSNHFLERVCTGEGQTYLGEQVVKCYHGTASDELVSVAFSRLAESVTVLSTSTPSTEAYTAAATATRCTIQLLETLLQSGVASSRASSVRSLLEAVKGGFGELLKLDATLTALASVPPLISIIGIALRCTDAPTEKATADLYLDCLSLCASLAISSMNGPDQESSALSTVLLDTCSHLLLALPDLSPSTRTPAVQHFLHPSSSTGPRAPEISLPDSTFVRLTHLFGSYAPACPVPNPWELLDHGEPSGIASTSTTAVPSNSLTQLTASPVPPLGTRPPLTNLGPIDLAAFRARVVETVPSVTAFDALSTTSSSSTSSARPSSFTTTSEPRGKQINFDFETPCTGLSVQAKDHRRTISLAKNLALKFDQTANSSVTANSGVGNSSAGRKRNVTGAEVATSKASSSTVGNGGTSATSNLQSTNGSSAPSTRGTKRKGTASSNAEVIVIDDEDDEEISQPAKPPPAKKAKGTRKKRS